MNDINIDVTESINNELNTNDVVLFMKGTPDFPMCGFSAATVQVLKNLGVSFNSINVFSNFLLLFVLLSMQILFDQNLHI